MDPITMSAPGTTIPGAMIGFVDGDLIETTVSGGGSVSGLIGPRHGGFTGQPHRRFLISWTEWRRT
jgi:hypothetical protein